RLCGHAVESSYAGRSRGAALLFQHAVSSQRRMVDAGWGPRRRERPSPSPFPVGQGPPTTAAARRMVVLPPQRIEAEGAASALAERYHLRATRRGDPVGRAAYGSYRREHPSPRGDPSGPKTSPAVGSGAVPVSGIAVTAPRPSPRGG